MSDHRSGGCFCSPEKLIADMETQIATTPFGRRPASLAQIAAQMKLRDAMTAARAPGSNIPAAVNKWQLFRTLAEIRERLGISDRALSVLNALLSFHPETALTLGQGERAADDLVVYPSNRQLSLRAHGMAEVTIRRHLAALVEAGLIIRRDSPNGKRYARRGEGGAPAAVFGFDLAPLVARTTEFEAEAEALRRARRERQFTKERISLRRRDIQKWLALALDEDLPGDWEPLRRRFMGTMTPLRGLRSQADLEQLSEALEQLHAEVSKQLETLKLAQFMTGNGAQFDQHKTSSKTESPTDVEPASTEAGLEPEDSAGDGASDDAALALGLVTEACPDIVEWSERGAITNWEQLQLTADRVRPMLGISADAWTAARAGLGPRRAAMVLAFILQRSEHSSEAARLPDGALSINGSPPVRSAGGYLRNLTEKGEVGELRLGPLLMALISQRLKQRRRRP